MAHELGSLPPIASAHQNDEPLSTFVDRPYQPGASWMPYTHCFVGRWKGRAA